MEMICFTGLAFAIVTYTIVEVIIIGVIGAVIMFVALLCTMKERRDRGK